MLPSASPWEQVWWAVSAAAPEHLSASPQEQALGVVPAAPRARPLMVPPLEHPSASPWEQVSYALPAAPPEHPSASPREQALCVFPEAPREHLFPEEMWLPREHRSRLLWEQASHMAAPLVHRSPSLGQMSEAAPLGHQSPPLRWEQESGVEGGSQWEHVCLPGRMCTGFAACHIQSGAWPAVKQGRAGPASHTGMAVAVRPCRG